jgi:competence protein ComEA
MEARVLKRASFLVLALCSLRMAVAGVRRPLLEPDPGSEDGATLAELLEESAETRDEDRRRSRPLQPGERIDPNRATEVELDRLPGIGPSTAFRIVEWREQVGGFAGPADLLAVRGVGPSTLERIENNLDWSTNTKSGGQTGTASLDLNRANRSELERLPGIGPTLAGRILELRASLGGFRRLEDLERVRGVGAGTLEKIRPFVVVGSSRS